MKKIVFLFVAILILFAVLSVGKNIFAKASISAGVKAITGLRLEMQSMDVGILNTLVEIKGLKLFNPRGYKDKLMMDMPEIYVDYDLGAFFSGKVHLEELRLNLKEFIVVKNEKGELNLDSLKVAKAGKEPRRETKRDTQKQDFKIDSLQLKIGKVIYKDYSKGSSPSVTEYRVNINERYSNITDPNAFIDLIVVKALMNTTIASLANFDLKPLAAELGGTLKGAGRLATDTAKETLDKTVEIGKEVGVKAKDTAKEAADTIKKILPFGE